MAGTGTSMLDKCLKFMGSTKINILAVLAVILIFVVLFSVKGIDRNDKCYKEAMHFLLVDGNLTADTVNINSVRCSDEFPRGQWELKGTYSGNGQTPGKPFYFQEIRGGMAASGSDTYYEICLIIGNETTISKIETGRGMVYRSPASCTWQNSLMGG
jgi:hypothetical protein